MLMVRWTELAQRTVWLQTEQIVPVRRQVFGFDQSNWKVARCQLPVPEPFEERELPSTALMLAIVPQVPAGISERQRPTGEVEKEQQKRVDDDQNTEFGEIVADRE